MRDCSVLFDQTAIAALKKNNVGLQTVIRAHQVMQDGYKLHKFGENSGIPLVITVFSAPNYCGSYNNKGAVLMLSNNAVKLKTFSDEPRHFCLAPG